MPKPSRNYDVPRWKDEGPLLDPGPGYKDFIRKATERTTLRQGILKHKSGRAERFYAESLNMRRLTGTPGIMPVWDIDDTRPDEPRWYAMPHAQSLNEALGPDATLREVVQAVAFLAGVLARLAETEGTYHRDIKPANLFWLDGTPVLADFGIAAWLTTSPETRVAGITRPTERLGPANFIAPEMRLGRPDVDDPGTKADVYSLAKTLFVLALPHRGPYPPDGTHRADGDEFSMGDIGGASPLAELQQVLEAATEFSARSRLSMPAFRDELRAWLAHYPGEQFRRRSDRPGYATLEAWGRQASQARQHKEYTDRMMVPYIRQLADALTGDPTAWVNENGEGNGEVLGNYDWDLVDDEGDFLGEGWVWKATTATGGRRIVLFAVLDGYVSFVGESQTGGPPWQLEKHWGTTGWSRLRLPRTFDRLQEITDQAIAWIATVTAQPSDESSLPAQADKDEQPEHDDASQHAADPSQAAQRDDRGQQTD